MAQTYRRCESGVSLIETVALGERPVAEFSWLFGSPGGCSFETINHLLPSIHRSEFHQTLWSPLLLAEQTFRGVTLKDQKSAHALGVLAA